MESLAASRGECFELLDLGIAVFDQERRLVHCNPAFRILRQYPDNLCRPGVTLEALLRFNAERGDFGPGDPSTQVADRLNEIDQTQSRDVERVMADGQVLRISYRRTPSGDLMVTYEDRTVERRAQADLAKSEERYALVSEAAEEAIYEWDIEAKRFYASPRLRALIDRDWGEAAKRPWEWKDIIHPDDQRHYEEALERHLCGKEPRWRCEYRIQASGGAWRWVSDHGTSVRSEDGHAIRMVAAVQDISDRVAKDAALAASEERYMLVTQATADGIYDLNVIDDVLYVSENLTCMLDLGEGAKGAGAWAGRVHPDDYDRYAAETRAHFKGEIDAIDCEYRVRGRDGSWRWIHDRGVRVRVEGGRVTRLVGALRDITDLKQAKAELGRVEARLISSLATISDGILLVDADDRVELWNDRYYEIFSDAAGGADLSEVIANGRPFFEMIRDGYQLGMFKPHAGGTEGWISERRQAWERPVARWEVELANGTWILFNERRLPDGGHISVYTDITELKEREEEIRKQSEILELTLENMGQGITLVDKHLRTLALNKKFLELLELPEERFGRGFTMEEAFRYNAERGEYGPGDVEEKVRERLELAAKFLPHRFERTRPDGTVIEIVGNPIEGGGFVSTYTDITEVNANREALIAARDEAQAALADLLKAQQRLVQSEKMASLGQLTAGIAHEIKNPLNFVNNFAELSEDLLNELSEVLGKSIKALDEETRDDAEDLLATARENLAKIREHGKRADSIVKNMLAHSREGPSKAQVAPLNSIAEEALNLAYHGARAEHPDYNVELAKELDPEIGEVECYPQDVMRVLVNLISNAIYATNKKRATSQKDFLPRIALSTRARHDCIEIEIHDNGTGIAPELHEKIFMPFFTTKPTGEGTGLGLSLSYDIITKEHGGGLTVTSEPGEFTAFHIELPRKLPAVRSDRE